MMGILLAALDIFLIIGSVGLAIAWGRRSQLVSLVFGGQALLIFVAGVIFLFQGWRLDPLLSFATVITHSIVVASLLKDWLILAIVGDR